MQRDFLEFADGTFDLSAFVAKVEIQLAVRTKDECVYAVVVVETGDAGKKQFAFVGFIVAVGVGQYENIRRGRDDHFIAQNADAKRCIDAGVLVKGFDTIGPTVAVGIFQDHDAIAFGALDPPTLKGRSIVGALSNPHTAARIDVHVARVYDHRLGREKRGFQTVGSGQLFHVGAGGLGAGGMGGRSGSGFSLWRGLFCPGSPERNR